ncbi:phosphoserine phosphatase SerB [Orrella sp. 11846]|uniref:phosphoserine phosphatase SerB n=1 Tax=Orrella sp. 11846 TaxID=3409913 RepID=UPI003B59CFCF
MSRDLVIQSPALDKHLIDQIAAIAQANGVKWTSKSAARLLSASEAPEDKQAVVQWCQDLLADYAYVDPQAEFSDCKILVMDMDSTLINIECIDEIAAFAGRKDEVSSITERAMRGEIASFSESLRLRVAFLEGLDASVLNDVYTQRLQLNPGAQELITAAQKAGIRTLLVSGGFTFFTKRLQERLGLDETQANTLEEDSQGRLTGRVLGDIVDAQAKADYLNQFAQKHGVTSPDQVIAIGDGANDLKMMALATYSVAYRAKPVVQAQANFALNHSPLDAVVNWFKETE